MNVLQAIYLYIQVSEGWHNIQECVKTLAITEIKELIKTLCQCQLYCQNCIQLNPFLSCADFSVSNMFSLLPYASGVISTLTNYLTGKDQVQYLKSLCSR